MLTGMTLAPGASCHTRICQGPLREGKFTSGCFSQVLNRSQDSVARMASLIPEAAFLNEGTPKHHIPSRTSAAKSQIPKEIGLAWLQAPTEQTLPPAPPTLLSAAQGSLSPQYPTSKSTFLHAVFRDLTPSTSIIKLTSQVFVTKVLFIRILHCT